MFYRKSKISKDKNTHVVLGVVFAVFIFAQFVTLNHQIEHLNNYNDSACVHCLSTPDQLDDYVVSLLLFHPQESIVYKIKHETKFTTLTPKAYSARAPPSIT